MNWLRNFMMGRYGPDSLSLFLIVVSLVCTLTSSLFGGVLYGIGMVCLIRSNSSVGGTDLLNRLLVVAFPQVSVGKMCMIIDGAAVVFAMIAFRNVQLGLYAIIQASGGKALMAARS